MIIKILLVSNIILMSNLMFFSCKKSGYLETTLSGTVKGFEADSLKITFYQNNTWESKLELWMPIDSTGRFSISLPVHSLKEFRMLQSRVILQPDWKVTMNIYMNEEGKMDSTTFDGDGAEENKIYNKNLSLIFDSYNHMNKEPGDFIAFLDSIEQVMSVDVENLKKADQEFVTMLQNNIAYYKMECWESYARKQYDFAEKDRPDSLEAYSSQFDNLMVFDNSSLLNSLMYKTMLEGHFRDMVRDRINFDELLENNKGDIEKTREDYNLASLNLMLDLADSIIPNQEIKSYVYFNAFNNALLRNINMQLIESVKHIFTGRFQQVVTDTFITTYISNKIFHLEKLSPGKPAPVFSYPDTTGNKVKLTDFKGKYVYIDVWATWCVPCIREMPKLKELERAFGEEIGFISISIDTEKKRWHKYVRENKLTGKQILSQGGGRAEIMDLYMIQAIPRFIMVDPEGNIVDVDASKPSEDKTKQIFEDWTGREEVDYEPIQYKNI